MTYSIYDEAIADAKKIRDMAEDKVKERIYESMAPKIKELIEENIFSKKEKQSLNEIKEDRSFRQKNKLTEVSREPAYDEDLIQDDIKSEIDYEIIPESYKTLNKIFNKDYKLINLEKSLQEAEDSLKKLKKAESILLESDTTSNKFDFLLEKLQTKVELLKTNDILTINQKLLERFLHINKELEEMSRRRLNQKQLKESLDALFEADELDLDALTDSEGGDASSGSASDSDDSTEMVPKTEVAQAIEDALDSLAQELDLDIKMMPEDSEMSEEEPVIDEDSDDTEKDLDEMDLTGEGEHDTSEGAYMNMEIDEASMDEDPMDEDPMEGEMCEDDIIEIDESMLRKEIWKMKALREGEAKDMASHFGGGSLEKEMFVDIDKNFMNKLSEAKSRIMRVNRAAKKVVNENRALKSKLAQSKKEVAEIKQQLLEMNLFNAKLLYANKLMQNRDLTLSQQKKIVEGLDNAKTLNEAKLLFESLSSSLTANKPMNENASKRILSSSSKAVSSSQSRINESNELDRWSILAGIKR